MNEKLSILQVITQRRYSGAERTCLTLYAEMQRRGHRGLLLCKPDGGMPEEAQKTGVAVQTPAISGKLNLVAPFSCVAHLSAKKGQEYLLQALALLKDRFPNLVCLLAGEGEMFNALQQRSIELGIHYALHTP